MRVLVADPFQTGHHLMYLHHVTEMFLKTGVDVVAAGDFDDEYKDKFNYMTQQYSTRLKCVKLTDNHSRTFRRSVSEYTESVKSRWRAVNELVISSDDGFDFVFLPWLDSYISGKLESGFYDCFKWIGIYFQPYFLNKLNLRIDRIRFHDPASLFAHRSCAGLASLVDSDEVQTHAVFKGKPLYFIPDFTDMEINPVKEFSHEIELKRKGRFTIGLYGSLAKRKDIMQLLQAVEKYNLCSEYFFIIAGELIDHDFSPKDKEYMFDMIHYNNDSFFFHPNRLDSESEFNYLMSQCDVVFAGYANFFYSSNMLIKSAELNKPVIVTKNTYMGDEVEKYHLGLTIDLEPEAIARAIDEINNNPGSITDEELSGKYVEKHSLHNLEKVIARLLEDFGSSASQVGSVECERPEP